MLLELRFLINRREAIEVSGKIKTMLTCLLLGVLHDKLLHEDFLHHKGCACKVATSPHHGLTALKSQSRSGLALVSFQPLPHAIGGVADAAFAQAEAFEAGDAFFVEDGFDLGDVVNFFFGRTKNSAE